MTEGVGSIELRGVSRVYAGARPVHALRDVTLTFPQGSVTGVIGRSGSGKSTLLNVLGLLDRPDAGDYLLDGWSLANADDRTRTAIRARHIGFVFQQFHLLPYRNALMNVELGLQVVELPRRERLVKSRAALEAVGLGDRVGHLPSQLSGGEQQRVAVARALVGAPMLLLCDEPTGSLDTGTAAEILAVIAGLRSPERVIVLVTHDEKVAAIADRCVEIVDGRVHL